MAGGNAVPGTSGGISGDGGDDGEDEDDVFLPPKLHGTHLTIHFPLLVPMACLIGG